MSEETRVCALTTVPIPPDEAFALFTEEVDTWWRHGPRYRAAINGKEGVMRFEPGVGGRFLEVYDDAADEIRFERVDRGTRVSVEHYGFDALGFDHKVWHGQDRDAFVGSMGLWWGDLLVALRMAGSSHAILDSTGSNSGRSGTGIQRNR